MLALNYLPVPSACVLSLVFYARVLFPIFFRDKGARNNKRCFYYNVTVEILSLFRLGRGTSQQSKYLAAYLSREVSSWQCDIRRYENNFYYTLQLGKGDIYLQFSEYYFTVQDHSMACFILFFLCMEWHCTLLHIFPSCYHELLNFARYHLQSQASSHTKKL